MILVVDVGNTNINFGVYDKEDMLVMFKLTSKISCTSDEFGLRICCLLDLNKIDRTKIDGAIIASVVPGVMHSLIASIQRYIGCKPLIVGPGIKTGIRVATENPKEMGADR
ncbi:MAG: type III pantothenate kinase, partial [Lachnospiraceae bacterium]|nr:type III pantothenate kinase [Lachnospiraceae bacterium]